MLYRLMYEKCTKLVKLKSIFVTYFCLNSKQILSARRFCELNREKADELFGTDSARLFPKEDLYKSLRRR